MRVSGCHDGNRRDLHKTANAVPRLWLVGCQTNGPSGQVSLKSAIAQGLRTEISILHLGIQDDIPNRSDEQHRSNQDTRERKVVDPLPPCRPFISSAPCSHGFIVGIEFGRSIDVSLVVVWVHGTRWVLRLARTVGVGQ